LPAVVVANGGQVADHATPESNSGSFIETDRDCMVASFMKTLIFAITLALASSACLADDDSDIISGCAMSNAEFGTEMIGICIKENQAALAEIARYPGEMKDIIARCSRRKEMGWGIVKKCIDDDVAAGPVLEAYARDHGPLLEHCQDEFRGREASRIKLCVEKALEAQKAGENK